jgi:HEAT repeat protein
MPVSRLTAAACICVVLAFTSCASPFPRESVKGSAAKTGIQAADSTPADAGLQESRLTSIQAGQTGEDREAIEPAQQEQLANQAVEAAQSLGAAALDEWKDADSSAAAGAVQPLTQNADRVELAAIQAAAASEDREALTKYMQDANAAVQAAAFDALAAQDNPAAVENLAAEIKDDSQPVRLQALQLLTESPQADEQIVMTVLIDALNGADASFSGYAAKALAERGTPQAMDALSERLNSSDTSTRLTVLQSVAGTEAGLTLLRSALSDTNEAVRSAAAALLQQSEATTSLGTGR